LDGSKDVFRDSRVVLLLRHSREKLLKRRGREGWRPPNHLFRHEVTGRKDRDPRTYLLNDVEPMGAEQHHVTIARVKS
jgi:hypothetical protein